MSKHFVNMMFVKYKNGPLQEGPIFVFYFLNTSNLLPT